MKRLITAALVAGTLSMAVPGTNESALAAPQAKTQVAASSGSTDVGAHRRHRRHHAQHRFHTGTFYSPPYYARPAYYRPYPYTTPAPFTFGFGFGPFH